VLILKNKNEGLLDSLNKLETWRDSNIHGTDWIQKNKVKELVVGVIKQIQDLFDSEIQSISNDQQLGQKWEKLLTTFMVNLKKDVLALLEKGDSEK